MTAVNLGLTKTSGDAYSALGIPPHDHITNSYTTGNLTGVVFRRGGAGGTIVGTLTLTYDGSNNLLTVART